MSVLDAVLNVFKVTPRTDMQGEKGEAPPINELGVYDSNLYGNKPFTVYNPDVLLINKGADVYRKMRRDDQVKATVAFKRDAIISREFYFENGEDNPDFEKQSDFYRFMFGDMDGSFNDSLNGILSGMPNGMSITEKVWRSLEWEGQQMWGLKSLKLRPFQTFRFEIDEHGNILKAIQDGLTGDIDMPLSKIIHFVHAPDEDEVWGEADLRGVYRDYWGKDVIIKLRNMHLERHASGMILATLDRRLDDPDMSRLRKFLRNISSRVGGIIPSGVDIKVHQPVSTDAFDKAIASSDKAIAKSMLMPNLLGLAEQGQTGSFAQSKTQFEGFLWVLDQIAARLEESINEHILKQLAFWNFGTDQFPRFKFQPMTREQKADLFKLWAQLVKDKVVTTQEADEVFIREQLGMPELQEVPEPEPNPDAPPVDDEPVVPDEPDPEDDPDIPKQDPISPGGEEAVPANPNNKAWLNTVLARDPEHYARIMETYEHRPWLQRVNFAKLEKAMDKNEKKLGTDLSDIMGVVGLDVYAQIDKMAKGRSLDNVGFEEAAKVKVKPASKTAFRAVLSEGLNDGVDTGFEGAVKELPKKFAKAKQNKKDAGSYVDSRSFTTTGTTMTAVDNIVRNTLFNAIKNGSGVRDVIATLKADPAFVALIPKTETVIINGVATTRAVNVPARIATISRTSYADAINQGREALFNSTEFQGFIVAQEYSAILDDTTSEFCEENHGLIRIDWGARTPPNHFNCRSITVPVTAVDDWSGKQDPESRLEPSPGFR